MGLVIDNTPWEVYTLQGIDVHVKREDLSCPFPGPSFSKIRGVMMHLNELQEKGINSVGVLDTYHSKAGWGVAYLAQALGMTCYNFYPVYKREGTLDNHKLRHAQQVSEGMGAFLYPLQAGRSDVLMHMASRQLRDIDKTAIMLPNALKLPHTVQGTAEELKRSTSSNLLDGTWVVSGSSCTIAAGIVKGLHDLLGRYIIDVCIVVHMGYSRSIPRIKSYMSDMSGADVTKDMDVVIVDEGYSYKDKARDGVSPSFPCNVYYDLKAWRWLDKVIDSLVQPITFWNIGA